MRRSRCHTVGSGRHRQREGTRSVGSRVRELIGECQRLYSDMGPIEAIHEHIRVFPIAHCWYMAVRRASEAVILLTDSGYDLEASPLRRYLIEHVVALRWLAEANDDADTAILRGHQHWLRNLQSNAQTAGAGAEPVAAQPHKWCLASGRRVRLGTRERGVPLEERQRPNIVSAPPWRGLSRSTCAEVGPKVGNFLRVRLLG